MAPEDEARRPTAAETLASWREAERLASVARRGRQAAETAARAAEEAAAAATATATAARDAAVAARLAEESAAKTAESARLVVEAANADLLATGEEEARSDRGATEARERYREAVAEAERRSPPMPAP